MQGDIVEQGFALMLYGMGTVVLFLALLVMATGLMSRVVGRYFPDPVSAPLRKPRVDEPGGVDPGIVAAIAAALHRHRGRRR